MRHSRRARFPAIDSGGSIDPRDRRRFPELRFAFRPEPAELAGVAASYGPSGEAAASVLKKGWLVAVDGRIEWRSWETDDVKRQAHSLVGNIEFLAAPKGEAGEHAPPVATPVAAGPVSTGGDDDIPF